MFILNFHALGDIGLQSREDRFRIDSNFFGAILETVRGRKDVRITFDDSNESDYTMALPLLKRAGIKARFFLIAGRIGQAGYLSRQQIKALQEEGMTIGNHGMHHRQWSALNNRELEEEMIEARDRIEQVIGIPVSEAACPFGAYNRRVLRCLKNAGYRKVYTSDRGTANLDAWIQPRNTIVCSDTLESIRSFTSGSPSRQQALLRALKLAVKRWR
jgi:peptidoglycan/xylan/chitin deacetylase (PgdA/CDA1 family)